MRPGPPDGSPNVEHKTGRQVAVLDQQVAVLEWAAWGGFLLPHLLGDTGFRIATDPFRPFPEADFETVCRRAATDGVLSSAHDCSDGGLAVALAESCIAGGLGLRGTFSATGRWDAALFGERQSRIVVSVSPDRLQHLERACAAEGVPLAVIGRVGGESLALPGHLDVGVVEMAAAWGGGLEAALAVMTIDES